MSFFNIEAATDLDKLICKEKQEFNPKEGVKQLLNLKIKGITITSKPRPDGRYEGRIYRGLNKPFYGRSREEVAEKIFNYLTSNISVKEPKKNGITVKAWFDQWYSLYREGKRAAKTLKEDLRYKDMFCDRFGSRLLSSITTTEIQEFLNETEKERGNRTMCLLYNVLSIAFKKAFKDPAIRLKYNPMDNIEIVKKPAEEKKIFSVEIQNKFLKVINEHAHELEFLLMLGSGLSPEETLVLEKKDFNRANKSVKINKSVVWIDSEKIVKAPKTKARYRYMPVLERVFVLLEKYPDEGPIFNIQSDGLRLSFNKVMEKLGLENEGYTPYSLRHTFSTRCQENRIPIKVLQRWMGHAKATMTLNTYSHVLDDWELALIPKLNEIFGNKKDDKKEHFDDKNDDKNDPN